MYKFVFINESNTVVYTSIGNFTSNAIALDLGHEMYQSLNKRFPNCTVDTIVVY